mmetsp:Transcript_18184/g.28210  ORF Transcript_18184/g.28210 Transcript_18184/m.28210 type:complete len:203 (-) Transcript_18184:579-1187(-)
MTRGWLLAVVLVILLPCALAKGKGGKGARGSSNGEEEIIIPLGGEMDFGGPQGGGFSIPLSPQMIAPQMGNMGGNGGSMGFEETEEIGPDGKPHIISEHSFGGPMKGAVNKGKPLTAAQKKQQKMMKKQMEGMAKDMAHMFDDGSFFGGTFTDSSFLLMPLSRNPGKAPIPGLFGLRLGMFTFWVHAIAPYLIIVCRPSSGR